MTYNDIGGIVVWMNNTENRAFFCLEMNLLITIAMFVINMP